MSTANIVALVAVVVTVVTAMSGGLFIYISSRRTSSGKIATTEASVLWAQSQAIMEMLRTEKSSAEAQRDKLIDSYSNQVLPALSQLVAGFQILQKMITDMQAEIRDRNRS